MAALARTSVTLLVLSAVAMVVIGQFVRPADDEEEFPCSGEEAALYKAQGIPFAKLSWKEKLELLYKLGGTYIPSLMRIRKDDSPVDSVPPSDPVAVNNRANSKTGRKVNATPKRSVNEDYDKCTHRAQPYNTMDTADNYQYRRMCTVCEDMHIPAIETFPEYFFESVCDDTELGCLYDDHDPSKANGLCQQMTLAVQVLKKDPDKCHLQLKDGVVLITEVWDIAYERIRVGCECAISRNSTFT